MPAEVYEVVMVVFEAPVAVEVGTPEEAKRMTTTIRKVGGEPKKRRDMDNGC